MHMFIPITVRLCSGKLLLLPTASAVHACSCCRPSIASVESRYCCSGGCAAACAACLPQQQATPRHVEQPL